MRVPERKNRTMKSNLPRVICWMFLFLLIFSARELAAAATEAAIVERAKAEGEVVLYTAWGLDTV